MVKSNKKKIVGSKNFQLKPVPKPLIEIIVNVQNELQEKENRKKVGKKKKISFVYAALEFSKRSKK